MVDIQAEIAEEGIGKTASQSFAPSSAILALLIDIEFGAGPN